MAIKLADTLEPMGNFPSAYADDVWMDNLGTTVPEAIEDSARQINANIATGNNAYTDILVELIGRLSNVEDNLKYDKYTVRDNVSFTDGHYKRDFLPNHERLLFCTSIDLSYTATFTSAGNEELKINNKVTSIPVESGEQTINIKVICEGMSTRIYANDVLLTENKDSIILTIDLGLSEGSGVINDFAYTYNYVPYSMVNVDYPYPIYERRHWEGIPDVITVNGTEITVSAEIKSALQATYPYEPSIYYCTLPFQKGNFEGVQYNNYAAQYQIGTGYSISTGWYANSYDNQVEDFYMANWDLSETTTVQNLFEWTGNSFRERGFNKGRRFDYSKLNLKKLGSVTPMNFCLYPRFNWSPTKGSFINSLDLKNIKRIYMAQAFGVESFGDLSSIDISSFNSMQDLFMGCLSLKYAGDIGKWKVTNKITNTKALFRQCYNLKGISKEIGNWDMSASTTIENIFLDARYIGDAEFELLYKWNTQSVTSMIGAFGYGVVPGQEVGDYEDLYIQHFGALPLISSKRTDLSFVENWNVANVVSFKSFAQNNPYLVELGDLRNWTLTSANDFTAFIKNCTALENLKMPNIPNGSDVTDFAKGCTSLANITVDELNISSISFEDCPLTKTSVLNLINASTVSTDITLSQVVYDAYASDPDVTSAIAAKASSSITVQLIRAA